MMSAKARNVAFVLLGVAGLVLKGQSSGPYRDVVHSYGGNVTASFAVYFLATRYPGLSRALTAGLALAVVELFEALNGFGIMHNVYDPVDLWANAVGVALALTVDAVAGRRHLDSPESGGSP